MSESPIDEAALILRCRKGEADAIRQLVVAYERPIFHIIWRSVGNQEDARDLTQETFVRAIRALDRFDLSRPFRNWIFRIASNLAIDHLRRRHMRTVSLDIDPDDERGMRAPVLVDPGGRPDEVHEQTWLSEKLAALVDRLPPEYRLVIHLRHREQLSYEEIAETLGVPLGTVKARLHRAHHRLRALWIGAMPGEGGGEDGPETL
jgi:RNA polymerase sigma-70 factor (ECF subfamily)